jgi:predicted nucleic acid-binding Zn ribbon protein
MSRYRRKSPSIKTLGEALQELTGELGIDKKLHEYEAITRWEECVGKRIAEEAVPVRITKGVLVVRVRTSTWRNELTLQKKDIINRLNSTIGSSIVHDIRFQ